MTQSKPGLTTRIASRVVYSYLRATPLRRGQDLLWRYAAKNFLVSQLAAGPWMRTTGLTDGEKMLFMRDLKEPKSAKFVSEGLRPKMVAVDVGANVGYFTLILAQGVGPEGAVHAFEPTPVLAERVRFNVSLNGFTHVQINQLAVADSVGQASLQISAEDPEANSLFDLGASHGAVSVGTMTLDTYAKIHNLPQIDLIKIDCEGSELNVLRGASSLVKPERAPTILVECNRGTLSAAGSSVAELCNFLGNAGYDCFCLERLREEPDAVWNIVAVKPNSDWHPLVERYSLPRFTAV